MKQQGCAALDADVAQAEEQRAVRLAMALDAKQLAARIGAVDLRLEILDPSALAISFRRGGERGGRRYHQQHTDEAGEISHGASFFEIFRQRFTRKPGTGHAPYPNLSRERSLAFSASISRSRAGACVCSDARRRRAEAVTSATARSNASALACDGLLKPESFRTNCSAEAWISSSVAGGSKMNTVLMLRHICSSFIPGTAHDRRSRFLPNPRTIGRRKIQHRGPFCHRMSD